MNLSDISGVQATVMGLGLHGGGIETARFLCRHGATVTVTDTRTEKELAPSLERLDGLPIRFVLGRHETADFERADFVVKNPAVPRSAPYLSAARRIETDISLFLKLCSNRLIALTGSKGKSTTASAVHHVLKELPEGSRLGGNITVSPLSFLDDLPERVPVVLELSSFQLGDLHLVDGGEGWKLLKPQVSVITNILPDHQNYYHSMQAYIADKRVIYRAQERDQFTVCCYDQREGRDFADDTGASAVLFSKSELPSSLSGGYLRGERGWFRDAGVEAEILGPSTHPATTRLNLLTAAVALLHAGVPAEILRERLPEFPGVEHRMET
ncbi:UDP-N-acetylmuramoyl-L-alanine--D-glutamate ligase, partial [Salinispira pacifica]